MAPDTDDGQGDALPDPLVAVIRDPSLGKRRLPYLLGFLEHQNARLRLTASWAICLVAETDDEMLDVVVRRLVDRLDEDAPMEIRHTLDYLAARNTRAVDDVLTELETEAEVRARQLMYQTGGGFARNEYLARSEGDRPIGRTRIAGESRDPGPQQVYTNDADDEPEWRRTDDGSEEDADSDGADAESDDAGVSGGTADEPTLTRGRIALISRRLSTIVEHSRFDDLEVLSDRQHGRYADVYRTVGSVDDEEEAVGLALFRLPESQVDSFVEDLSSAMGYWTEVDDHDGLVTVYDWDWQPRPWAAVEYTDLTLTDRENVTLSEAVWSGVRLASAVSHAHQHGVIHAAIDPSNVVYYGNALREEDRRAPMLTNVGLTSLYRHYFDPASVLDPSYAAPEYFNDSFGRVDHASDVYGLGAVLYRLCTGQDPYTGPLDAIREQATAGDPPRPSTVDDAIPASVDRVVRKAMAPRKLKRYETVNQFERELRSIGDNG